MNIKAILLVDFDDTIVDSKFPQIIGLKNKAKETLNRLYADGYYIIINTCRTGSEEQRVVDFLRSHDVNFHLINENHPKLIECFGEDSRKLSGDIYIDDKSLEMKLFRKMARSNGTATNFEKVLWDYYEDAIRETVERDETFNSILNYAK